MGARFPAGGFGSWWCPPTALLQRVSCTSPEGKVQPSPVVGEVLHPREVLHPLRDARPTKTAHSILGHPTSSWRGRLSTQGCRIHHDPVLAKPGRCFYHTSSLVPAPPEPPEPQPRGTATPGDPGIVPAPQSLPGCRMEVRGSLRLPPCSKWAETLHMPPPH